MTQITNELRAFAVSVPLPFAKCFDLLTVKGAIHLNAIFLPHGFNGNFSFTFQAIQKPYHYPVKLCCGVFCKFLGGFWIYLGGVVFLEGLVKLREIRNIEDLVKF